MIWRCSLVTRFIVFPFCHLSMGSSGKYQIRFIIVSQSGRMDQWKNKGYLLKLYYHNLLKPLRVQRDRLPSIRNKPVKECREPVDVTKDRYLPASLEDPARSKRGKSIRSVVRPEARIPGDWTAYLRVDENKQELFFYRLNTLT